MPNYVVSDTSLTAVADAIRTKGGTSAPLSFPDDFVEAIDDISGGGSISWEEMLDRDVTIVADNPNYFQVPTYNESFSLGETYRVTWGTGGTQYICQTTAETYGFTVDGCYIGNPGILGGTDTGEPFIIYKRTSTQLVGCTNSSVPVGSIHVVLEKQVSSGGVTVEPLSVTANGTYTAPSGTAYSPVSVDVPSNYTLLGTLSVGSISTTSTTATDTGQSITVKGIYDYDLLVCECSVDTNTNNTHAATTRMAWLTASSDVSTKNGATFATATWNCRLSSSGVATTRSSTTAYGVYANACTVSAGSTGDNGQAVITIYQRYNSTQTGTINGTYTMRVYGVKIYDLIGG